MKRSLGLVAASLIAASCGSATSTAPTATTPTPTPSTYTLSGQVTSTTGAAIAGAAIRIADGANAGRSTSSDGNGTYTLTGLTVSGFTVNISAANYSSASTAVTLTSNQTVNVRLTPTPLFTASGTGNTVFDMPATVATLHVTGSYTGSSSNFIIWVGPAGSSCSVSVSSGCRLIVNVIIGTFGGNRPTYDGIVQTGGGGVVSISNSAGVAWSFTEVR